MNHKKWLVNLEVRLKETEMSKDILEEFKLTVFKQVSMCESSQNIQGGTPNFAQELNSTQNRLSGSLADIQNSDVEYICGPEDIISNGVHSGTAVDALYSVEFSFSGTKCSKVD